MTCPEENQLSDRTFTRRFAKEYIDYHSKILHDIKLPFLDQKIMVSDPKHKEMISELFLTPSDINLIKCVLI